MVMRPGRLFLILAFSLLLGNEVITCIASLSRSSLSTSNVHHLCISEEKEALLEFKRSFVAPQYNICDFDTSPPKTQSWNEEVHTGANNDTTGDCCSWEGVECDVLTGHVIGLDLHCGQLYGKIPSNSTLFQLSHLRKLDLSNNDFNGSSISPAFGLNFPHLTHLDLSHSKFSGLIPPEIAHLSQLISLTIYSSYRGQLRLKPLAFEMLIKNQTQLETLVFNGVTIASPIPEYIGNLSSLSDIQLSEGKLYGEIPQEMFDLPNLRSLNLAWNGGLVGYLPKSNWNCSSSLYWLQLRKVRFSSEFPDLACCQKSLLFLDLYGGDFFGYIPPSLGNFSKLISLDLSRNNFTGQVPVTLSNLKYLESLSLPFNSFEGEIPDAFARLTKLRTLNFGGNNFIGKFPQWLANLTELSSLHLQSNKLTGHIPSNISELQNLYKLFLSNNSIGGPIPIGLFALPLYHLYLSSNQLSGTIPSNLTDNGRLQTIDLRNNNLSGTIDPLSFVNLKSLTDLDLTHNSLQGPLPLIPHSISFLLISHNKFQGDIPPSICGSIMLRVFDLSHNNLSGMIPKCISNFSDALSVLNFGMNGLSGTIPMSFAAGNQLRFINLNGNHLEGQVPQSLANCIHLQVLDLGNNLIIDTFPYWLELLPELQVLVLRHNKFHGMLGLSRINKVTFFPKLRILDLSHNEFIGPLPTNYFPSLNAMTNVNTTIPSWLWPYMGYIEYDDTVLITLKGVDFEVQRILVDFVIIDLSSNRFQGEIPDDMGSLLGIHSLNLSSNALTGNIPSSLAKLTRLESLDLSSNQLSGVIPQELTHITFLQLLNLSSNHLTGPIPRGFQFDTFQNDSYSGNWGLCGPPLSKGCSDNGAPHGQPSQEESEEGGLFDGFGWKVVLLGYGCGTVFGLGVGFVMFATGKPKRLMTFVEEELLKITKRTGCRNLGFVEKVRMYREEEEVEDDEKIVSILNRIG